MFIYMCSITYLVFRIFRLEVHTYDSYAEIFGNIVLSIGSTYLIFEILKDEQDEKSLFAHEYFWLAIGVLLYSITSSIIVSLLAYIPFYFQNNLNDIIIYTDNTVYVLLNIFLIISFICRRTMKL